MVRCQDFADHAQCLQRNPKTGDEGLGDVLTNDSTGVSIHSPCGNMMLGLVVTARRLHWPWPQPRH